QPIRDGGDRNGESEESSVWRLCDQLQGMHRLARRHHGSEAHRSLRDDEEDLGLRQEEETGQEVGLADPGRIVLTLPGAFRTLRLRRRSEAAHPSGLARA